MTNPRPDEHVSDAAKAVSASIFGMGLLIVAGGILWLAIALVRAVAGWPS